MDWGAPLLPSLGLATDQVYRAGYGLLLGLTLLLNLPNARRFFVSERWGGYAADSPTAALVQHRLVMPLVLGLWLGCAVLITLGWWSPWPALINVLLCYYFFVRLRWASLTRGLGAPGFMTYWAGVSVLLLEVTRIYAPSVRSLALLVVQWDFAFIMLSAGLYKLTAGYSRAHGVELGLANPAWGYWWRWFGRTPASWWVYRIADHLGWIAQTVAALLMLLPPTRLVGGLLIALVFVPIIPLVRLGVLCQLVILCALLFVPAGGLPDRLLESIVGAGSATPAAADPPALLVLGLLVALIAYLLLLPLAHAGLYFNLLGRRSLPRPLQRLLELYTNATGIIIWRVFSVDVIDFYVDIFRQAPDGTRTRVSDYGPGGSWRFNSVGESIAITSIFTTLKYHPSNSQLFQTRLLRYARTIPHQQADVLVFAYVRVAKAADRFVYEPVVEFLVDVARSHIEERQLVPGISIRSGDAVSPVHEGRRPGSYAPLPRRA